MSFRRAGRGMSLRPVNRIKHVVDFQGGTAVAGNATVDLIDTTDTPVLADNNGCETGSKVNAIYLNVEGYATSAAALANIYMVVFKNPGANLVIPANNAVGIDDNKKYVIHQEMKMFEQSVNGNPRTIFNGVIVIPRGYRRNGPKDKLTVQFLTPGVSSFLCLQCHYKEFR